MKLDREFFVCVFGEFCATAMLLTLHCTGTDKVAAKDGVFQWGLNYGLAVMICMQTFECVSGAHINPCITLAAIIMGKIDYLLAIAYIVVQFLGGIFGFVIAYYMTTAHWAQSNYCVTEPSASMNTMQALMWEFLMTAAWILARCASWDSREASIQESVSLRVGLTVSSIAISGGYFTGASMNPARTLPPALFAGNFHHIWIYFAGPLLAGGTMPLLWKFVFSESKSDE